MAGLVIPKALKERIVGTELDAPTSALVDGVEAVLSDNEMPFFPAYTDHGVQHVTDLLETAVCLVPDEVMERGLIKAKDAAVLCCAALLHDLAMHVRDEGFLLLVHEDTPFKSGPWFSEIQPGRPADAGWAQLWSKFQLEARHFGAGQIKLILGPEGRIPAVAHEKNLDPRNWTDDDRLLIGEFLRRHHARLAHEIALYGFPGLDSKVFPVLGEVLPSLADLCGAVARSHNEPLRSMLGYLDYLAPRSKRQEGTVALYHMALLRIADYLQLGVDRAPLLLLRLKNPQSPLSVEEWQKGGAVSSVDWDHDDPYAIYVTVDARHGLRTHLALTDLFRDLQQELDITSAVLDEQFGGAGSLSSLSLTKRRVLTNLNEQSLHDQLPYAPCHAALRSDPDLFRLVIKDLYGNQPVVAGRELVQNAVDAVRARRRMERTTKTSVPASDLQDLHADVVVTVEELPTGRWILRVADMGIGMTPDLVVNYFLQAGASFGPTPVELEKLDRDGLLEVMKAGRFGVGAFAAFLLGPEIRVVTRHVDAPRGLKFVAQLDSDVIKLEWDDSARVGTVVEVPFEAATLPLGRWQSERQTPGQFLNDVARFYRLKDPKVGYVYRATSQTEDIEAPGDIPIPHGRLPDYWRKVRTPQGYDGILWSVSADRKGESGHIAHNGIEIRELTDHLVLEDEIYRLSGRELRELLRRPSIAVFDPRHQLPLALHRYRLVDPMLPFENDLLESIGLDFVAHGLAAAGESHPLQQGLGFSGVFSKEQWMPLLPSLLARYLRGCLLVVWEVEHPIEDELMSRSPTLSDAVAFRSVVSWGDFPHRSGVKLDTVDRDSGYYEEHLEWGHAMGWVERSVEELAERLCGSALATVVIRGNARPSEVQEGRSGNVFYDEMWDWRDVSEKKDKASGEGIFLQGEFARELEIERKLVQAACALRDADGFDSVAMSVIGNFVGSDRGESRISAPWGRYVDGGLHRGPRKWGKAVEEILAEHPSLRPAVSKWQRLLEKEKIRRKTEAKRRAAAPW